MLWALLTLLNGPAEASEGPWTTARGIHNIYLGVMGERFRCFEAQGQSSTACASGLPVAAPVAKLGAKAFYRTGLTGKTDVAVGIPVARSFSLESTSSPMYATTTGLGLIEGRVRYRLGKIYNIDFAAGAGVRSGAAHHASRGRMTNLGEGSTDLQATLYAGRMAPVGPRFHVTSVDLSYFYRLPLDADTAVGRIPGDEIRVSGVSTVAVTSHLGLGLSADGFWRLWGEPLSMSRVSVYGEDRWASLKASQIKLGGRVVIYPGDHRPYLQFSGMRAIWAKNNPLDTTQVEIAVGVDIGGAK